MIASLSAPDLTTALAARIDDVLGPLIPRGGRCALLDFPNHANVGDSAIFLGECEWLRRRGADIVYQCDLDTYCYTHLAERIGDGTILLHGGGNFGDLWRKYQKFREMVAVRFPENPIIQLPQSIHYCDPARLAASRRALNGHRNFTLLCRDQPSLELASREFSVSAAMCPDMAFAIGPIERATAPRTDILWLARTDHESSGVSCPEAADVKRVDWLDEPASLLRRTHQDLAAKLRKNPADSAAVLDALMATFQPLARQRLQRGCELLCRGRVVVTDRLHGHILCLLLGIPHVVMDNCYGKIRRFHHAFTANSPLTHVARDPEEAMTIARSLVKQAPPVDRLPWEAEIISGSWASERDKAREELAGLTAPGDTVVLIDGEQWRLAWSGSDALAGRSILPFLEKDGAYWGAPADDEAAVRELERIRNTGATLVALAAPSFWWREVYALFYRYLQQHYRCVLDNDRLLAFCLDAGDGKAPPTAGDDSPGIDWDREVEMSLQAATPTQQYVEQFGAIWHETEPPRPFHRQPPVKHGSRAADFRAVERGTFPAMGVVVMTGAQVVGTAGWIVGQENRVLSDQSWHGDEMAKLAISKRGYLRQRIPGTVATIATDFASINYGHFLLDSIGRLHLLESAEFGLDRIDRIILSRPPTRSIASMLVQLGFTEDKTVYAADGVIYEPDILLSPSFPGTRRNFAEWLPSYLRNRLGPLPKPAGRRLFLNRSKNCTRRLLNESALFQQLQPFGFEALDPAEEMDTPAAFAQASIVVSAHSAALADLVFCPPGTRVLELIPSDHCYPYYYTLADASHHQYGYLIGPSLHDRPPGTFGPSPYDFSIDEDEFAKAVPWIIGDIEGA